MNFKSVKDLGALKHQELVDADISDNQMLIEYLAMMSDVELPTTSSDSTSEYRNTEETIEEE